MNNFAILSGFGFRFLGSDFTGAILGDNRLKFDFSLDLRSKSGGFFFCSPKGERGLFYCRRQSGFFSCCSASQCNFWGLFFGLSPVLILTFRSVLFRLGLGRSSLVFRSRFLSLNFGLGSNFRLLNFGSRFARFGFSFLDF